MACLGKARIGSARHSPAWFGTGRHCPAALSSPSLSVRRAGAAAITWPPPRGGARRRRACAAVDGGHEAAAAGGAGGAGGGRAGRRPTALPRHGQQPRCGGPGSSSGLGEVLGRAARCRRTCSNCGVLYFLKENSRGWPVRRGGWTSRLCAARALPPAEGIRPAVSACCPGASRAGLRGQAATAGAGGTSSPLPAARQGAGLSCSSSSWSQLPQLLTTPSQFQHVLLLFLYCVVLQGRLSSSSSWLHAEGGFQHFMLIYYHFHDLSLICCKSFTWHKAVISWFSVGLVHLLAGRFSEHLRPYRESKVPAIPLSVCFEHPSSSSLACIWLTPVQGSLENTQEKPEYSCDTIKKKKIR